jgi:hypothetical protein
MGGSSRKTSVRHATWPTGPICHAPGASAATSCVAQLTIVVPLLQDWVSPATALGCSGNSERRL